MSRSRTPSKTTLKPVLSMALVLVGAAAMCLATPANLAFARTSPDAISTTVRTLDKGLSEVSFGTKQASSSLGAARRDVGSTRKHIERAHALLRKISKMERRLNKLTRKLVPMRSIPKVGTAVRLLLKNLRKLNGAFRKLRAKATSVDKKVLIPSRRKLQELEAKLIAAQKKLGAVLTTSESTRQKLARAGNSGSGRSMKAAARQILPAAKNTRRTAGQVNGKVASVRRELNKLRRGLAGLRGFEKALASMDRKMRPAEKFAAKLSKALNKRIGIKKFSFSVRQVLEGFDKIGKTILKPLRKVADKILQPILKTAKLELRAPAGMSQLPGKFNQLASLGTSATRAMDQASTFLSRDLPRQADNFIANVRRHIR